MKIELRVSAAKLTHLQHDIHIAHYVMRELQRAGVPVEGTLFPRGLSNGELRTTYDDLTEELVYTWIGEQPLAKAVPAAVVEELEDMS